MTWMDPESIMPRKMTEKYKYPMISHYVESNKQEDKLTDTE